MNDLEGRTTESSGTESEDRQGSEVSPARKRNRVIRKCSHGDLEQIENGVACHTLTCREPPANTFHQAPQRNRSWVKVKAALASTSCTEGKCSGGDVVFNNTGESCFQAQLSRRLPRNTAHATPLVSMSPATDTFSACLEHSELPLRLSNTHNAPDPKTWSRRGHHCGTPSLEMTSAERNRVLNPTSRARCPKIILESLRASSENPGNEQLQTITDDATNASKKVPLCLQHKRGEHLSDDCCFSTGNLKCPRKSGSVMVYDDKLKHECKPHESSQLNAVSKTFKSAHNASTVNAVSCCDVTSSYTEYIDRSGQNIHAECKTHDDKCNKGANRNNRNHDNVESCQNINAASNGSSKNVSLGSNENCNKNNNSNDHLDSDGSSDGEYNEINDTCQVSRQRPEFSNDVPPTGHHIDTENPQEKHRDSVDEYFKHISRDSSRHATSDQMEHNTETSTGFACESLTSNDGEVCKLTIHNTPVIDVLQQGEFPVEELAAINCESDHEFHKYNSSNKFLFIGEAGVQPHTELHAQKNTETENCSSVGICKTAETTRVNSFNNQDLQMKEEDNQIRDSHRCHEAKQSNDNQKRSEVSASRIELCLCQDFDDDLNRMSDTMVGDFQPSQEDFTENNGTLQASPLDKTIAFEGKKSTELTKPVRTSRECFDESEILNFWDGSVHIRQTAQCSLEDLKCVNFLSMLTHRLTEYTNKDVFTSNPECFAENEQSQPDYNISKNTPTSIEAHAYDHERISFGKITSRDIHTSLTNADTHDQPREYADAILDNKPEKDVDCALPEQPKTCVGSEEKTHSSLENVISSNAAVGNSLTIPSKDTRPCCTEYVPLEIPSDCQQTEANVSYEQWSTKYTMSLSDQFLQKYDVLTTQSKEKYKKSPDALKGGMTDLKRNINYEFADPAFEVDVFRSLEYATSLSCGLSSEKRTFGPAAYKENSFGREFNSLAVPHQEENSRSNGGLAYDRERVSITAPDCQKTFPVADESTLCPISEEEAANYSRARIMRASERRRKLMTEFEEITSCVDVYNWPRYDRKHFCYESGNFCQDLDIPVKRQVNNLQSAVQVEGKHMIGTFTIDYLKPPVSGFVLLK